MRLQRTKCSIGKLMNAVNHAPFHSYDINERKTEINEKIRRKERQIKRDEEFYGIKNARKCRMVFNESNILNRFPGCQLFITLAGKKTARWLEATSKFTTSRKKFIAANKANLKCSILFQPRVTRFTGFQTRSSLVFDRQLARDDSLLVEGPARISLLVYLRRWINY